MMATPKPKPETKSKAKAKPDVRTKKSVAASAGGKRRTLKSDKHVPAEEEIRIKAQEIYNERIARGEHASAEDDWLKAEKLLRG